MVAALQSSPDGSSTTTITTDGSSTTNHHQTVAALQPSPDGSITTTITRRHARCPAQVPVWLLESRAATSAAAPVRAPCRLTDSPGRQERPVPSDINGVGEAKERQPNTARVCKLNKSPQCGELLPSTGRPDWLTALMRETQAIVVRPDFLLLALIGDRGVQLPLLTADDQIYKEDYKAWVSQIGCADITSIECTKPGLEKFWRNSGTPCIQSNIKTVSCQITGSADMSLRGQPYKKITQYLNTIILHEILAIQEDHAVSQHDHFTRDFSHTRRSGQLKTRSVQGWPAR
ncbi:hypothetical protein RRG08_065049 [Elysia crispata]|uniref:Uncharacterized protein n=1 Tax=Elysia crispata TaxID=231223 RepID=A0AAE0ZL98_9GAST|nr:hypothetical protein RRG08_065049 [Elysia crispata]